LEKEVLSPFLSQILSFFFKFLQISSF